MREYAQQFLSNISTQRITDNSFYINPSGQDQSFGSNRIIQRL